MWSADGAGAYGKWCGTISGQPVIGLGWMKITTMLFTGDIWDGTPGSHPWSSFVEICLDNLNCVNSVIRARSQTPDMGVTYVAKVYQLPFIASMCP